MRRRGCPWPHQAWLPLNARLCRGALGTGSPWHREQRARGAEGTGLPSCLPPCPAVLLPPRAVPQCQGRAGCSGDSREGNHSPLQSTQLCWPTSALRAKTQQKCWSLFHPAHSSLCLLPHCLSITIYSFCTQFRDPSSALFFLGFIGHCSFFSQDVRQD